MSELDEALHIWIFEGCQLPNDYTHLHNLDLGVMRHITVVGCKSVTQVFLLEDNVIAHPFTVLPKDCSILAHFWSL